MDHAMALSAYNEKMENVRKTANAGAGAAGCTHLVIGDKR